MSLLVEEDVRNTYRYKPGKYKCGFCQSRHCKLCPGLVGNATNENPDRTWMCPCYYNGHKTM
jgi:hypothetical protein